MRRAPLTIFLTAVHNFCKDTARLTKPRRRWKRDDVVTAVKLGSIVANIAGAIHPAARPIGVIISSALNLIPNASSPQFGGNTPEQRRLWIELQTLEFRMQKATTPEELAELRGQRKLLFRLLDTQPTQHIGEKDV